MCPRVLATQGEFFIPGGKGAGRGHEPFSALEAFEMISCVYPVKNLHKLLTQHQYEETGSPFFTFTFVNAVCKEKVVSDLMRSDAPSDERPSLSNRILGSCYSIPVQL